MRAERSNPPVCAHPSGDRRVALLLAMTGVWGVLMTDLCAVFSKVVDVWLKVGHGGGGGVGNLGRWFWGSSGLGFYPLRKVNPRIDA